MGMTISSSPGPSGRVAGFGAGGARTSSGGSNGAPSASWRIGAGIGAPGPARNSPDASTASCKSGGSAGGNSTPAGTAVAVPSSACARRACATASEWSAPARAVSWWAIGPGRTAPAGGAGTGKRRVAGTTGAARYALSASERSVPTWISPGFGNGIESTRRATLPAGLPPPDARSPSEAEWRCGSSAAIGTERPSSMAWGAAASCATGTLYPPATAVRSSPSRRAASAGAGSAPERDARRVTRRRRASVAPDGAASPNAAPSGDAPSRDLSIAARRMGPASPFSKTLPSGARNATTRSPRKRISLRARRRSARAASGAASPAPATCRAQSAHGSPVICPSCSGWPDATMRGSAGASRPADGSVRATSSRSSAVGKKTVSGCIQYRSRVPVTVETGAVHPATIRAVPAATAWASSSSARTRTGAKSARAATRPSPRAAAVPPTAPGPSLGSPPVNTAVTFPASSVNLCEPDTEADAPELARRPARSVQSEIMRCHRASLEAAAIAHHRRRDGLLRGPVVGERELAEVAHHHDLLLLLDHDVVEVVQVELVDVQPRRGGADDRLRHVRLARELGIAFDEALDERFLGQLAAERARDVGGEFLRVEDRRLFGEPVHRAPEE